MESRQKRLMDGGVSGRDGECEIPLSTVICYAWSFLAVESPGPGKTRVE